MTAQVQVLTLLSKVRIDKGIYAVSFDVAQKKKTESVKKKRQSEEQAYVEHESVVGGCSPEIELPLKNRKCDIKITVTGALKPLTEWEQGEDILEYNESLGECRKLFTFVPISDAASGDTATIKFRVQDKVKHTVTIHDIRVPRCSTGSFSSLSSVGEEAYSRQISRKSNESSALESSMEQTSIDEGTSMKGLAAKSDDLLQEPAKEKVDLESGSVHENFDTASGEGHWNRNEAQAVPDPPRPLNEEIGRRIAHQGPDVVPPEPYPEETAYDKILCNESLSTLSRVLTPADASRLIIGLGVPNATREHNHRNHQNDVVTANYESLLYWRNQRRSKRQEHEASNQHLFEDLLSELDDVGRKDIKVWIKQSLEQNKKLEKRDFKHD